MNNKQIILLFVLSSIFLLPSCYKQIEIEFPQSETSAVLNCLFTNDSIFNVKINKTSDFNDSISYPVTGAVCKLYTDNQLVEALKSVDKDGFYSTTSGYTAKYNTIYKIEISSSNLPTITAIDKLPNPPQILNISKQDSVMLDEEGSYLNQLNITINDPVDVLNFYELTCFAYYKYDYSEVWWLDSIGLQEVDTSYQKTLLTPQSQDVVIKNEGLLDYAPTTLPFSDALFNGQVYNLNFNYLIPTYSIVYNDYTINTITNYKLIVSIRSISENYFKYKKKFIIHQANQYSDFWDGIAEPVQMFTNVENGYGVFAGYSTFVDTIQ